MNACYLKRLIKDIHAVTKTINMNYTCGNLYIIKDRHYTRVNTI